MLNDIVKCCLKLNKISTHHLYLGTVFLLLTYLGVFLFLLQALLLMHLFSSYPCFFFCLSTHYQGESIRQFIKTLVGRIIGFNIFSSLFISSESSMRSVRPLQTHYLGCIYKLLNFPLSQWNSFVCNSWKTFHQQILSWWSHKGSDTKGLWQTFHKNDAYILVKYFPNFLLSLFQNFKKIVIRSPWYAHVYFVHLAYVVTFAYCKIQQSNRNIMQVTCVILNFPVVVFKNKLKKRWN